MRIRRACHSITLPVKLKLLVSFGMIVAQIGDVYQLRYPSDYQSLTTRIFSPLRLELFEVIFRDDVKIAGGGGDIFLSSYCGGPLMKAAFITYTVVF